MTRTNPHNGVERAVGPDDIREALFANRRPVVRPLFEPNRTVRVTFEKADARPKSLLDRIIRFLDNR